jgi:OmpA-OmpF porin, OOP family
MGDARQGVVVAPQTTLQRMDMSEKGIWLGGLAALAILSFFCIRHHLADEAEPAAVAAAVPAQVSPAQAPPAPAPVATAPAPAPSLSARFDAGALVLEGLVPDDATRRAIVERATAIYGAGKVTDRLQVGAAAAPAWAAGLFASFPPDLRSLSGAGSARAADGRIVLEGTLPDEAARTQLADAVAAANPQAQLDNRLAVAQAVATGQAIAEQLKSQVVEFAFNSAVLTPKGAATLDTLVPLFERDLTSRFEIAGHTDSVGDTRANQFLSESRARTVAAYLTMKGISPDRFAIKGYAASQAAAANATADGRQRNRRIEFRPL